MTYKIIQGDCIEGMRQIADESVHCVVTSPPYYGLRDYGTATWEGGDANCDHKGKPLATRANVNKNTRGGTDVKNATYFEPFKDICGKCGATRVDQQIGLEETPEAYVEKMVNVFREVRRILRSDGTVWLNLGDSYAGNGISQPQRDVSGGFSGRDKGTRGNQGYSKASGAGIEKKIPENLKPKDLIGIPWRVAFALQADGWWLRQDIIWHKPNPMPESVTDRCTKSHEYIFLLTKSERYYYDAEAVKEKASGDSGFAKQRISGNAFISKNKSEYIKDASSGHGYESFIDNGTRNKRSVWTVTTQPYAEAHFAVYPPKLIEPCILAGTSARGCCASCGTPWVRTLEVVSPDGRKAITTQGRNARDENGNVLIGDNMIDSGNRGSFNASKGLLSKSTIGWEPSCECQSSTVPCVVFDPFTGSGTTAYVALTNGRSYIGTELNPAYIEIAERRLSAIQPRMELI